MRICCLPLKPKNPPLIHKTKSLYYLALKNEVNKNEKWFRNIGSYKTKEEAILARKEYENKLYNLERR